MNESRTSSRQRHPRARARLRAARTSRGQSLVELALILPIFLLIIGTATDFARLFYAYVTIESAAKEGVMFGAVQPGCATATSQPAPTCADPNNVAWHVVNESQALSGVTSSASCIHDGSPVSVTACQPGDTYSVRASYTFTLITPLLEPILGSSVPISSEAEAVVYNPGSGPGGTPVPACDLSPSFTANESGSSGKVSFTGASTGSPTSWAWTFGDGSTGTGQTTSHKYSTAGSYAVTLTVSDSTCTMSTTVSTEVK